MLVRNNTKCPSCGIKAATDVYAPSGIKWSSDLVTLRAECFECLGFVDREIPVRDVRLWLRELSKTVPSSDDRRRYRYWTVSDKPLTRSQFRSLSCALEDFLPGYVVDPNFAEHSMLSELARIIRTSGDTVPPTYPSFPDYAWLAL